MSDDVKEQMEEAQQAAQMLADSVRSLLAALRAAQQQQQQPGGGSSSSEQQQEEMTQLERAQALLAVARAVHTMHVLRQRASSGVAGLAPGSAAEKEEKRLAVYANKVNKAVAADMLSKARKSATLNVAAANRFIDAAIPELSAEQKAALRQPAGNAGKGSASKQQAGKQQEQQEQQAPQQGRGKRAKAQEQQPSSPAAAQQGGGGKRLKGSSAGGPGTSTVARDAALAFLATLNKPGHAAAATGVQITRAKTPDAHLPVSQPSHVEEPSSD